MAKLTVTTAMLTLCAATANAQPPGYFDPLAQDSEQRPVVVQPARKLGKLETTETWGGGLRLTGLSGIGALPGVNFGGEVAVLVRNHERFAELALGRWKPEKPMMVTTEPEPLELALNVWTLRAGWASMRMPLRIWGLVEIGEVAGQGAMAMPGVVTRMVMGDTPHERQWRAVGAGIGVAWPMSQQARLVGNMEIAVPINREEVMLDQGIYEPDPMAARYSLGLEVGWR